MVICQNDPQSGDGGAGSLLYNGNILLPFVGWNGYGPNWSWAEMVICQNDPHSGDFGAGSPLYNGHMIQILAIFGHK